MKNFRNTIIRSFSITILATAATAATLCVSCSRDGDAMQGGERRELAISVQMQSSDWTTRASGANPANTSPSAVALDEQLEIVTEYGTQGAPEAPEAPEPQDTPEAPLTRGTPIISASGLNTLGFAVYTNSVFTKNCTATNTGGSWNIAGNMTVTVDKDTYSYYAYAPTAAGDNGIKLNEADGKSLTYTAPTDITKQPDLCWATPIPADKSGSATFAMQHALTAVGIKVRAANVTIKSITLNQVNTAGTLNLTNGTWGSVTTPKDLAFTLSNTKPSTGDGIANITPTDGYLMLPPQSLSGDNQTLTIVYQYTTGDDLTEHTGTHKLSAITGGNWAAGQKINYVIQLKSNFSLTLNPASASVAFTAGSHTFGYTTGSSASSDPKLSCDAAWVTGLNPNRSNGTISFNYAAHTGSVARQATIKVTSGFTTQNFVLKQLVIDPSIKLSSTAPTMGRDGGSYTTIVTTPVGVAWKVASTSNCTVTPTSGSGSATVTITVPATTVERNVSVTFSTNAGIAGITEKTATWSGTQRNSVYINGIWWTWTNLTGNASTNGGHRLEANPQDKGMFFKWGSSFVYQRASGAEGGGWGDYGSGAPASPSSSSGSGSGYDYGLGLVGGLNPGDPCQKLGANYRTPTRTQWQSLINAGTKWDTYNGIAGRFLGPNAGSCNNSTIQPGCIFLPVAGFRIYWGDMRAEGNAHYWSSSVRKDINEKCHWCAFDAYSIDSNGGDYRSSGASVRCIYE